MKPTASSHPRAAFLALAATTLIMWSTHATASAQASRYRAEELLEQGVQLREAGEDAAALEAFEEAQRVSPSGQALAQIGLALQALGRFTEARIRLSDALMLGGTWVERYRSQLQEALGNIESRLARLEVETNVEGARVLVNGSDVATTPLLHSLYVEAGTVVLEILHEGYHPYRARVEMEEGAFERRSVRLVALPETAAALDAAEPSGDGLFTIAIASLSVGALGLATFAVSGALAESEFAEVEARCGLARTCEESDLVTLDRRALIADIGLGIGIAGALAGAILLPIALNEGPEDEPNLSLEIGPSSLTLRQSF